jgi:hypothetical protein
MIRRAGLAAVLVVAAGALAPTAMAAKAPRPLAPATIIAKLNAERSRLGMFAGVTEEPSWSAKCSLHNRWMKLNGRLQHPEIRGTRGYSADGHWAGTHAVLAQSGGWRVANPWRNGPIHLSQVYDPLLRRLGTSDAFSRSCMTTWPGIDLNASILPHGSPQADHIFTYPVDGGTAPFGQLASEVPYTPQEKVGLRRSQKTGPYLFVWSYSDLWHEAAGPRLVGHDENGQPIYIPATEGLRPLERIVGGSLTGPSGGSVPIKVIDAAAIEHSVNQGSGFLLPLRPLKPGAAYRATVVTATYLGTAHWGAPDRTVTHSWTFTTDRRALGYTPKGCRGRACRPWTWP